jgi:hypothetical protein
MNAVHNSILSPSFVPTLDAAEALFTAAQAEKERQQAAEAQAKETALQAQREEVRTWLATQIPPEFVPYVDLAEYSHYKAENVISSPNSGISGCQVQLNIPGAAPIRFHIIRRRRDGDMEFKLAWYRGYNAAEMCFGVPFDVKIEDFSDGDGDYQLNWIYSNSYTYSDFTLALGAAVSIWRERGELFALDLQDYHARKEDDEIIEHMFDGDEEEPEPYDEPFDSLIARLILEVTTLDLAKKRQKLDSKIDKFSAKLEKVDGDLAATFGSLFESEISAIMYACFLGGLSYGLCPCPSDTVEDYIVAAVSPIENANYIQWMGVETRIRQASPRLEAAYRSLDLLIALHKGIEQDAMFLHGMAVGQRIINAVSHPVEI